MNKNSTLINLDELDEYPEITNVDLEKAIHRRNFVGLPQKQNINLMLDVDIIEWFKKKSGETEFQSLVNATLRNVMVHGS